MVLVDSESPCRLADCGIASTTQPLAHASRIVISCPLELQAFGHAFEHREVPALNLKVSLPPETGEDVSLAIEQEKAATLLVQNCTNTLGQSLIGYVKTRGPFAHERQAGIETQVPHAESSPWLQTDSLLYSGGNFTQDQDTEEVFALIGMLDAGRLLPDDVPD